MVKVPRRAHFRYNKKTGEDSLVKAHMMTVSKHKKHVITNPVKPERPYDKNRYQFKKLNALRGPQFFNANEHDMAIKKLPENSKFVIDSFMNKGVRNAGERILYVNKDDRQLVLEFHGEENTILEFGKRLGCKINYRNLRDIDGYTYTLYRFIGKNDNHYIDGKVYTGSHSGSFVQIQFEDPKEYAIAKAKAYKINQKADIWA